MRWMAALLLVTGSLAGCLGDDGPDAEDPEGTDPPAAEDPPEGMEDDPGPADPGAPEPDPSPGNETNRTEPEPVAPYDLGAPFEYAATGCEEFLVFFPVAIDTARSMVPINYSLLTDDAGQAQGLAGLKVCETTTIDGEEVGPSSTSDVGLFIEAPDGTDGFHYYQLWWPTNHPLFAARLEAQGWLTGHTPGDGLNVTLTEAVAGEGSFNVPWSEGGAYGGTATIVAPPAPNDTPAVGWHDGPYGTVQVDKVLTADAQGGGTGTITASAGSMMETLIGGSETSGAVLYATYAMTGSVGPP